jgi:predicted amidohydrolase
MKVALIQMVCEKAQISQNLARTAEYVAQATDAGADLVCFPEMSITGYLDPPKHQDEIVTWNDSRLTPLFESSRTSHVTIVAGIVEANPDGMPFISQGVIRDGELLGVYRKNNVAPDELDWFASGSEPLVCTHGGVSFGLAIYADIDNGVFLSNTHQWERKWCSYPQPQGWTGRRNQGTGSQATGGGVRNVELN